VKLRPEKILSNYQTQFTPQRNIGQSMDLGIIAGIVMLAGWAIATFFFEAPGWVHIFLTAGVTMIIWRIVARKTPALPKRE
jgi:MFS family permease